MAVLRKYSATDAVGLLRTCEVTPAAMIEASAARIAAVESTANALPIRLLDVARAEMNTGTPGAGLRRAGCADRRGRAGGTDAGVRDDRARVVSALRWRRPILALLAVLLGTIARDCAAESQLSAAEHHLYGIGVEIDTAEAVRLARAGARSGEADAQAALAAMYRYGDGVEPDLSLARQWYAKAAAQGHAGARRALAEWPQGWVTDGIRDARTPTVACREGAPAGRRDAAAHDAIAALNLLSCGHEVGAPNCFWRSVGGSGCVAQLFRCGLDQGERGAMRADFQLDALLKRASADISALRFPRQIDLSSLSPSRLAAEPGVLRHGDTAILVRASRLDRAMVALETALETACAGPRPPQASSAAGSQGR